MHGKNNRKGKLTHLLNAVMLWLDNRDVIIERREGMREGWGRRFARSCYLRESRDVRSTTEELSAKKENMFEVVLFVAVRRVRQVNRTQKLQRSEKPSSHNTKNTL